MVVEDEGPELVIVHRSSQGAEELVPFRACCDVLVRNVWTPVLLLPGLTPRFPLKDRGHLVAEHLADERHRILRCFQAADLALNTEKCFLGCLLRQI